MFERSAAISRNTELPIEENAPTKPVIQHIADNADHNLCTLDGNGTLHGMAIIVAITPSGKMKYPIVTRKKVTDAEISEAGEIPIIQHTIDKRILSSITYTEVPNFIEYEDPTRKLDLLWLTSWFLKNPRSGWQGTMQAAMVANPR